MYLSKNFSLEEMCKSSTALRKGINNSPNQDQIKSLTVLCENILQPIRDQFGAFIVSSGFRCIDLCKAIGSKSTSQHAKGEAADIEIPGVDNAVLAKYIQDSLNFDQLILECYTGEPSSGWVHVSYVALHTNRKDVLTYDRTNGYRKGLII